jgi:hypothetical protein
LEQGPAHRAGEVRFRVTKGTFVGDKTGSVGHDETLRLNLGWFWHYDRPNRVPVGMDGLSREVSDTRLPFKKEPLCTATPGKHGSTSLNPSFRKKTPQS